MNAHLQPRDFSPALTGEIMETVLIKGDLKYLTPAERLTYYTAVCQSLNLNPLTKPFAYIELNGKLTLYALKACTDQLRQNHGISISILSHDLDGDLYSVHVKATDAQGREDEDFGVVVLPKAPLDRANAMLKAVTKAKRRVTLSIRGLGMLDESEMEDIPAGAKRHVTDIEVTTPCTDSNSLETRVDHSNETTENATLCTTRSPTPDSKPRMVADPPKRRLSADRRINDRYEKEIRADKSRRAFYSREQQAAAAAEMELGQDFVLMMDEISRITSVQSLHQWGDDNADRTAKQPPNKLSELRMAYANKLASLKPHSISQRATAARDSRRPSLAEEMNDELPGDLGPPKDDGLDIPPALRRSRNDQAASYLDLVAAE